jgi:hypothetical protein
MSRVIDMTSIFQINSILIKMIESRENDRFSFNCFFNGESI